MARMQRKERIKKGKDSEERMTMEVVALGKDSEEGKDSDERMARRGRK